MSASHPPAARRVVVGVDGDGRSCVVADCAVAETLLASGIRLEEIWQQRELPAAVDSLPASGWNLGSSAPAEGAVVRILTVPGVESGPPQSPELHSDRSLHVITMIEGRLEFILEDGVVALGVGETIVLRDSLHDLRNLGVVPARFVYTSFPIKDD